jgi:hypothetical protein
MDFGFVSPIGKGRKTNSYVQHGYASTDPTIGGESPSAIEYVSLSIAAPDYAPKEEKLTVGDWIVRVDAAEDLNALMNGLYRKNKMPVNVDVTWYAIERPVATKTSMTKKVALVEELQRAIARSLRNEGFEEMSDADLEDKTGMTRAEYARKAFEGIPYGRRQFLQMELGGTIRILFNCLIVIAVGMPVTGHPPHRSERARLRHSAPTLGD